MRRRPWGSAGSDLKIKESGHTATFGTELSQISSHIQSNFRNDMTYYIRDPLVAILGIGDYDHDVMPPLVGVNMDYINSIYTFHYILGYSVLFHNKLTNTVEYITKNENEKRNDYLNKCNKQVKTRWIDDQVEQFFKNVKTYTIRNQHDAVIFLISAHGDREGVILDSQGEEISLGHLFAPFQGKYCRHLVDKPKIVFVDACRGSMRAKPILALPEKPTQNNNKNNNKLSHSQPAKWSNLSRGAIPSSNDTQDVVIDFYNTSSTSVTTASATTASAGADKMSAGAGSVGSPGSAGGAGGAGGVAGAAGAPRSAIAGGVSAGKGANQNYYHSEANFRYIYGNPEGYAVADGGSKGGYLIRSIKRTFTNLDVSLNKTLDTIVHKIRKQTKKLVGRGIAQCVEDVNTMTYEVVFEKKRGIKIVKRNSNKIHHEQSKNNTPRHHPQPKSTGKKQTPTKNNIISPEEEGDNQDNQVKDTNINLDESNYENWTEEQVLQWLKKKLTEKTISSDKIKSFISEFRKQAISGSVLKELRDENNLKQLQSVFSGENQAFGIWMVIKTSVNNLG